MGGKRVEAQTTIKLTDCGHHSSRGGGSVINGVVSLHAVITMTPGDNNSPQCLSVWLLVLCSWVGQANELALTGNCDMMREAPRCMSRKVNGGNSFVVGETET